MLTVIPSINCPAGEEECVLSKLRLAETFAEWVHLDVADASFTQNRSWGDPAKWQLFHPAIKLEVHLMTEHPEWYAPAWLQAGAKRLVVHIETIADPEKGVPDLKKVCQEYGAELVIALLPETPLRTVRPWFSEIVSYQIFSQAYPGPAGQLFLPSVLPKIRELRQDLPQASIEVDGGINLETAKLAVEAGANVLVAGSYTLGSADPAGAYRKLGALENTESSKLQAPNKHQIPNKSKVPNRSKAPQRPIWNL